MNALSRASYEKGELAMQIKAGCFILFLAFSTFVSSGCAMVSKKDTNAQALEPQAVMKFNDLPVPVGLKPVPNASYSFENTGVRVGLLKYQGKAVPEQVVNFYRDQMPLYNWNLLNIIEYGERILNFERENETCIVTVLNKGNNVIVTIALGPKSPAAAKKSNKPVK
ncbi:MAG: hypothetical protein WC510_04950 [Candidatus Omnitrophota bacterium]